MLNSGYDTRFFRFSEKDVDLIEEVSVVKSRVVRRAIGETKAVGMSLKTTGRTFAAREF